jgi:hypothetical protein
MILEFKTIEGATAALELINYIAVGFWASQDYTVSQDKGVIGKNFLTEQDSPDNARTETWDTLKENPVNTYYINSLRNKGLEQGLTYLEEANIEFEEKTLPLEWLPSPNYS